MIEPKKTRLTKLAIKVVENGGNVSKSMRDVGYSNATSKNPQKITNSKTFRDIYEGMGRNQLALAKDTERLMNIKDPAEIVFKHSKKTVQVAIDEEDGRYSKTIGGKQFVTEYRYTPITTQKINKFIKSIKGAELIDISTDEFATTVKYFMPDKNILFKTTEMAHKIFGNFAPEKQEIEHTHILTEEDKKAIDEVFDEQLE